MEECIHHPIDKFHKRMKNNQYPNHTKYIKNEVCQGGSFCLRIGSQGSQVSCYCSTNILSQYKSGWVGIQIGSIIFQKRKPHKKERKTKDKFSDRLTVTFIRKDKWKGKSQKRKSKSRHIDLKSKY